MVRKKAPHDEPPSNCIFIVSIIFLHQGFRLASDLTSRRCLRFSYLDNTFLITLSVRLGTISSE